MISEERLKEVGIMSDNYCGGYGGVGVVRKYARVWFLSKVPKLTARRALPHLLLTLLDNEKRLREVEGRVVVGFENPLR